MPETIIIELHNVPLFLCVCGLTAVAYVIIRMGQIAVKKVKRCLG